MLSRSLEGASCAELDLSVVDKFFDNPTDKLYTKAAKNICSRCVVRPDCLTGAMNGPAPTSGIVAGYSAGEITTARRWRAYELGIRDTPPNRDRPEWLSRPDATETVEQGRIEDDPDEPGGAFA